MTNPLGVLPTEISFQVFSYLSAPELLRSSVVCKYWKIFVDSLPEDFWNWKPLCLQKAKKSDTTWKVHAINLHRQVKWLRESKPPYESDELTPLDRGLLFRGKFACSFVRFESGSAHFDVWDLEKENKIFEKEFLSYALVPLAIDYPYLVNQHRNTLSIFDLSDEFTFIADVNSSIIVNHISIKGTSLVWNDKKLLYFVRNFTKDTSYEILRDTHPLVEGEMDHQDNKYQTISFPILHEDLLIYGIENGIIRVRDLKSEKLSILYDLNPLEYSCIHEKTLDHDLVKITNLVADGNLLISFDFVESSIHIWDLETKKIIRIMTGEPGYHSHINILNHLLILSNNKLIKVWDIFSEKCIKELNEAKHSNPNYTTTFFFRNKIFQLAYGSALKKIIDYQQY